MAKDQDKTRSQNTDAVSAEPKDTGAKPAEPESNGQPAKQPRRARQSAAPRCPYHNKVCRSRHSDPYFTRYYCPVEGCGYMEKKPRPQLAQHGSRPDEDEDFSAR